MASSTSKYWWEEAQASDVPDLPSKRIYVMGMGSIGCLIAHSLASLQQRPPISLLLHRPGLWDEFQSQNYSIRLIRNADGIEDPKSDFDVDVLSGDKTTWKTYHTSRNPPADDTIDSLVLVVKAAATVSAIRSIRNRLRPSSTILLMQNGMGQVDELNSQVFTDPTLRPHYMQGIISHGLWLKEPFMPVHAGIGKLSLGMIPPPSAIPSNSSSTSSSSALTPHEENSLYVPTSRHLLLTLLQSPILTPTPLPYPRLLTTQLLKLTMNAINNPLTSILDIPNGHQLTNPSLNHQILPLLVTETSNILLALPEVRSLPPALRSEFHPNALEKKVKDTIYETRSNSSSMREDMKKGRETEIRYINGYLVKRGREVGMPTGLNEMLMGLVEAKGAERNGESGG